MHVLGLPPAFVLSQDQTLKFVSLTKQAQSEDRQPARQELQGADTCTVKRNGYEWTCIITYRTWSSARMWQSAYRLPVIAALRSADRAPSPTCPFIKN
ncbi:MAG TPA: hypothetical protein DCS24_09135 [Erythrobacter sp.]|nr:hypothetical protein [Erythrobacter sp.]